MARLEHNRAEPAGEPLVPATSASWRRPTIARRLATAMITAGGLALVGVWLPEPALVVVAGVAAVLIGGVLLRIAAWPDRIDPDADPTEATRKLLARADEAEAAHLRVQVALHESDARLRIAREIQFRLFPTNSPRATGFDIAGATFPADEVDGDYYDYFDLEDGSTIIAIADACGHGLGAALIAARTQACLHTLCRTLHDVREVLDVANDVLRDGMPENRFITLLLLRLEPEARRISYASAGHTTAYVLAPDGQTKQMLRSTTLPLGVEPRLPQHAADAVTMEPGDLLLMLTDGIEEALSPEGEPFGTQRILELVHARRSEPALHIVTALNDAVVAHCQPRDVRDDITAVLVRCVADQTLV